LAVAPAQAWQELVVGSSGQAPALSEAVAPGPAAEAVLSGQWEELAVWEAVAAAVQAR